MAKLDLMGSYEIGQEYGIPRYRITRLSRQGRWPATAADLHATGVWHRKDVELAVKRLKRDGVL